MQIIVKRSIIGYYYNIANNIISSLISISSQFQSVPEMRVSSGMRVSSRNESQFQKWESVPEMRVGSKKQHLFPEMTWEDEYKWNKKQAKNSGIWKSFPPSLTQGSKKYILSGLVSTYYGRKPVYVPLIYEVKGKSKQL